jgi:hypothetical protein
LLIGFALLLPLLLILVFLRVRQGACSDEKHCPADYEGHDHPVIDTNFHLNSFSHFSFTKTAVKRMICLLFVWLCALKDSFHKKCGSETGRGLSGKARPNAGVAAPWSLAISVTRQAGARRSQETARAWERKAPAWRGAN